MVKTRAGKRKTKVALVTRVKDGQTERTAHTRQLLSVAAQTNSLVVPAKTQENQSAKSKSSTKGKPSSKKRKGNITESSDGSSKRPKPTGQDTEVSVQDVDAAEPEEAEGQEVPIKFLKEACDEMRRACNEEYQGDKRQCERRTKAQPYTLANYQKRLWVERYLAARNRCEKVDYNDLATKIQFKAFKSEPAELKKHHQSLLKEVYAGYLKVLENKKNKANADPSAGLRELVASSNASLVTKIQELLSEGHEETKKELRRAIREEREISQAAKPLATGKIGKESSLDQVQAVAATLPTLVCDTEEEKQTLRAEFDLIYRKISVSLSAASDRKLKDLETSHVSKLEDLKARHLEAEEKIQELVRELDEEKLNSTTLREELEAQRKASTGRRGDKGKQKKLEEALRNKTAELAGEKAISSGYQKKVKYLETALNAARAKIEEQDEELEAAVRQINTKGKEVKSVSSTIRKKDKKGRGSMGEVKRTNAKGGVTKKLQGTTCEI